MTPPRDTAALAWRDAGWDSAPVVRFALGGWALAAWLAVQLVNWALPL